MNGPVPDVVIGVSLFLALVSLLHVAFGRDVGALLLAGCAVLECLLVVLLVVGVSAMLATNRDLERATFVAYLVGLLVVPPVAVAWSRGERSRYGTGVLLAGLLIVPVMVFRVQQVWAGPVV